MITDLKELQAFLKICRKQGVLDIKFDNMHVVFGEQPRKQAEGEATEEDIQTEGLTDEQLIDYHLNGLINENNAS